MDAKEVWAAHITGIAALYTLYSDPFVLGTGLVLLLLNYSLRGWLKTMFAVWVALYTAVSAVTAVPGAGSQRGHHRLRSIGKAGRPLTR